MPKEETMCNETVRPPGPTHFIQPVLKALGKATNFTAGVFVPNQPVLVDAVREAGFDPENLSQYGDPALGWKMPGKGPKNPEGLKRRAWRAFHRVAWRGHTKEPYALSGPEKGLWGMTEAGVVEARRLCGLPELKPASRSASMLPPTINFQEPMLRTLAKATRFKPGDFVDCGPVILDTLRDMGHDPDNLPNDWILGSKKGIARCVREAFRFAHRDWKEPLTMKGDKPGQWGLTRKGVAKAKNLMGGNGRNLTSAYLDQRFSDTGGMNGQLMLLLRSCVAKKLPVSATTGIVDDHIHNCILRLVQRDSLRERLLSGRLVPDTLLASYVVRSGYTDIRKMGTEPVCRELYGAKTEREREKGLKRNPLTDPRLVWGPGSGSDESLTVTDIEDTVSLDPAQKVMDEVDFEVIWADVEEAVKSRKPKAWARYLGVIKMRLDGWPVKEIAEAEGVSPYRAASIMAEARRCVRDAHSNGEMVAAFI